MNKFESDEERRKQIHKKMEDLRQRRRKWVDANRENGFEEGINNLLTELYPKNAHFIYELLQNAEDTCAIVVQFTLTNLAVEFEHNGERLFSFSDVESITSIGKSTKRDDPTSIGKFGVGFKAVFAYTSTSEIHSGNFHFCIHDLVVPETEGVPRPKMGDQETRFAFPFDNPKKPRGKAVDEIERGLRALGNNTLLFLSHIRKIEYLLPDGALGTLERIERQDGCIEIRASQPGGKETISHWLLFDKDVKVTDEDGKRKACRIAIAYRRLKKICDAAIDYWPLDISEVTYFDHAEGEHINYFGTPTAFLYKDKHFSLDKELRIIHYPNILEPTPSHIFLDVNLNDLIEEVVLQPKVDEGSVREALNKAGFEKIPVSASRDDRELLA